MKGLLLLLLIFAIPIIFVLLIMFLFDIIERQNEKQIKEDLKILNERIKQSEKMKETIYYLLMLENYNMKLEEIENLRFDKNKEGVSDEEN